MKTEIKIAKTVGSIIRKARKAQGLTQTQLAGLTNTGVRLISELERGKPTIRLCLALKVAEGLGLKFKLEGPRG